MSFTQQYPPVLTETGDNTSQVLSKYNQEFQYIYTTLLSQLFSASLGHGHTGNGSDGMKIATTGLADDAVTTAKILDANVTTEKIADDAITFEKLADACKSSLLSAIYPVGAVYMSVNGTSPATLFGGTWTQIKDRFLLSCGDTYANGATGGEATHTLSADEMPYHNHGIQGYGWGGTMGEPGGASLLSGSVQPNSFSTGYAGGNAAHNNMPPYLAVYVWKRVG